MPLRLSSSGGGRGGAPMALRRRQLVPGARSVGTQVDVCRWGCVYPPTCARRVAERRARAGPTPTVWFQCLAAATGGWDWRARGHDRQGGALGGDCGDWPRGRARFLVFSPHPSPSTPFSSGNRRGPSAAMAHGETRLVWSRSTPAAAATTMPEPRPLAPLALTPISHTPTGTSNGNGGHDQAVDNGTPRSPPPFARLDGEWTPARPSRSVRALSGRAR